MTTEHLHSPAGLRESGERVFIAADPPREIRAELSAWVRSAQPGPGSRPVPPGNIHLTLCFLGTRVPSEIEKVADVVRACEPIAPRLATGAPIWLPKRNPRALAVEVHDRDETLADLHASLARELAASLDWTAPARFRPHLTVARLGRKARPRHGGLTPTPQLEFKPPAVTLYRSKLHPDGAEYEVIESRPLTPGR